MPFYISKVFMFTCDYCGTQSEFILGKIVDVRKNGWAVSKDYRKCYCPKCAPKFRNVGQAYGGVCNWR